MYVLSTDMSGLNNSSTPMPASAVADQDAWIAAIGSRFVRGNADMAGIIAKLTTPEPTGSCDDLTSSDALYGDSSPFPFPVPLGVPAILTPAGSSPSAVGSPAPAGGSPSPAAGSSATSAGGATQAGLNTWPNYPWPGVMGDIRRSKVFPGFPCAGGQMRPSAPPVSIPVPVVATPTPAPAASAPAPSQSSCRTNNICIDMRRGCVRSDQVSVQQQFACSQAGYTGNEGFFPSIVAQKNLPFLGTPMPNPPPYSDPAVRALDVYPSGVSGFGDDSGDGSIDFSSPWVIGIGAAAAIALLFAMNKGRRKLRSRRAMQRVRGY